MYIKEVLLTNFQRHQSLEVTLTPKVNVIVGNTDVGKSSLIRAIRWVLFNKPEGESFRRRDPTTGLSKVTRVVLRLDDGTTVVRERSTGVNRYVVDRPGTPQVTLDSFGKGVPQQVIEALSGLSVVTFGQAGDVELNVARQGDNRFLVSSSASTRTAMMNRVTEAFRFDEASKGANLDAKREGDKQKVAAAAESDARASLKTLTLQETEANAALALAQSRRDVLKPSLDRLLALQRLEASLQGHATREGALMSARALIPQADEELVPQIETLVARESALRTLVSHMTRVDAETSGASQRLAGLPSVEMPAGLAVSIERLSALQALATRARTLRTMQETARAALRDADATLASGNEEIAALIASGAVCGACGAVSQHWSVT